MKIQAAASLPMMRKMEPSLKHQIRDDIIEGRIEAGARLVVADLAKRYGSSSNPVREALHHLQGEGFVVFSPNRGARVRVLGEDFVRDIYDIRALIEPYMVRWFVDHATNEELARMEVIQREIENSASDYFRYRELNELFHSIVYDRHFNREAVEMELRQREVLFMLNRRFVLSRARRQTSMLEHWGILEAIKSQNANEAARITEQHVRGACQHLLDQMRTARQAEALSQTSGRGVATDVVGR